MSLRICILETDVLRPELTAQYEGYGRMFEQLFARQPITAQFSVYNVMNGEYPAEDLKFDAYLVTGSKADSFGSDPWIQTLKAYLLKLYDQGEKLLGVCFGHQLLALTLGGNEGSLYQSRGISRFFMGKYQEALADFTQSVLISKDDAESRHYVLLWQGLAARRTGQPPSAELLQAARGKGSDDVWPNPLLALVAGSLGEDGVLQAAQRKQGDDKDMALTEAWYFIGQMRLASGNVPAAREAFENARKPGVSVYLEYQAAGWELARLEQAASK